ncbi:MAG: EscU/YscU/HrcU family type III secretion system export apparatus switch protein [Candidatus Wallbacteria bacterium]|nr:EscU/YscU/HrcU family type III secretion system export apparatus switch protein [Candidatus Wallbacteria bacterium]
MKKILEAIALKYTPEAGDGAPRVSASGKGLIARRIIDLAREHGVPVQEDSTLVQILSKIEVGDEIPEETFTIVAEILAMVVRMRRSAGIGENRDQR